MPAHSENFPWPSYYGHFRFFDENVEYHDRVRRLEFQGDGLYQVELTDHRSLKVFVCECYSFGLAEYHEVTDNHGDIDAVVIASAWCGYTGEVKEHCKNLDVGVFKIGEFMGALNSRDFVNYVPPEERAPRR